jgi:Mg2+ and Co2+ transporter CorA
MYEDVIKIVSDFAQLLGKIEQDWDQIYEEIHKTDCETGDLLHEIELTNFNAYEGYRLAKQLQEVRQRRRELKDTQEILQHLKDFYDNNKQLHITLFKLVKEMQKTKASQQNRSYIPRIRTDLKICQKHDLNLVN